jgi:membrane fusion protein, multidrug efflux system
VRVASTAYADIVATYLLRRRRTVLVVAAALLAAVLVRTLGLASLMTRIGEPARAEASDQSRRSGTSPAVAVKVAATVRADIPVRLSALGSVTAFNTVTVRPRVDGQLMRVLFREGQFVKQGELLAEIDTRPFDVQLKQAEGQFARDQAQLANARTDLTRYETLWKEDSIAQQNVTAQQATVNQLEAALTVDQAAIDNARLNLVYARITAPLSGRVGLRLVDAGNVVTAASTSGIVVITQVEPIAVVFTLPEDALRVVLPRIRAGAKLPVDAFDRGGTTHLARGTVVTLDNEIDQTTGTVRLKAVFDNRDRALFPSQFVNVQVLADTERAQLVVPAAAVQQGPRGTFVYVVHDSKVLVQPVTVGVTEAERASILSGLNAGDVVVTDGVDRLRNGVAVTTVS